MCSSGGGRTKYTKLKADEPNILIKRGPKAKWNFSSIAETSLYQSSAVTTWSEIRLLGWSPGIRRFNQMNFVWRLIEISGEWVDA